MFVVTDKGIYNIKGKKMKRKIPIKDIIGITKCAPPSKETTELTIHVDDSYDYRYSSKK